MISLSNIQAITNQCIGLLSLTERLRRNDQTKEAYSFAIELFPHLRKLFVASMMHDKHLICISGLQGAGKTSLMKNFYGIDDDFWNVSLARGESVPVLVTESDVKEPHISKIVLDKDESGNYSRHYIQLKKEEIIPATKGEDPSIMYLELTVPYKYLYNDCVSFMLLPGFEKNEYWNNLIEFSVKSSSSAVFVCDEPNLANSNNEELLKKITNTFGSNLVYVLSRADESLDDNAEVKSTFLKRFNIQEQDRVVCVGQYADKSKNDAWIESFKKAIDKYALFEAQVSDQSNGYIYDELISIKDTLYNILGKLNDGDAIEINDLKDHAILRAFDAAIAEKRKELARNITDEFSIAKDHSVEYIANRIGNSSDWKKIKRTLFGTTIKEQYLETREIIKSSLSENGNCLPDLYRGKAFQRSINLIENPEKSKPNALQLLVDSEEKDNKMMLLGSEDTKGAISDVCALVKVPEKGSERYYIQSVNQNRVVRAVAEVATYYYGLTSYERLAEKTSSLVSYSPDKSKLTGDTIIGEANSAKKFAGGLLGVMGIDILDDGSLNLISKIATSCSISLPYAGAAAILIVGIGAASAIMKDINRMQRTDFESASMTVQSIYDNIQRETLERFDIYTNDVRNRIKENLVDLRGDSKTIVDIYNAKVALNNLIDLLDNITDNYLNKSYEVGTTISR